MQIKNCFHINLFYLYICPPDPQKSDGGAIHREKQLLRPPEMSRYCCPVETFFVILVL